MTIQKMDEKWFRAEQKVNNGLLSFVIKNYASTPTKAIKKLTERIIKLS